VRSPRKNLIPGALTLAEEAVHMLRRQGRAALAEYYLGSLPFVLGLLYFWADMSRSSFARWYCAPAAAGVALLFMWMKLWQVRFCRRLWMRLQGTPAEAWPLRRNVITAARQAAIQATGFVALPAAALAALPLGWTYTFYQNVSVLDDSEGQDLMGVCKAAVRQAALWPGQNHVLLLIFSVFGLFVFGNLGIVLFVTPHLINTLLGVETIFTLSGFHALNTTFLAVVSALTYLCVDPIIKAAYVLRCFYGISRHTGDDLRAVLKPYLRVTAIALVLWLGTCVSAMAQDNTVQPGTSDTQELVRELDASIERVLQRPEFAWRLPRERTAERPEEESWVARFLEWVASGLRAVGRVLGRWIEAFVKWLLELLPRPESDKPIDRSSLLGTVRLIFYVLGAVLTALVLTLALRWWHRRQARKAPAVASPAVASVDLNDENVTADELPTERWLALAAELIRQQDFRSALRALYLAVLALLADHDRLAIARYKSNRDYFRELARRAHAEPELIQLFGRCITAFERTWYGMHTVGRPQVDRFAGYQERMAALVRH
jgi:hypothetical protein